MKILLTGATGYIGRRLMPVLLEKGNHVVCVVRDKSWLNIKKYKPEQVTVIEADLLKKDSLEHLPKDIDAAYYLVHSMDMSSGDFSEHELKSAQNFVDHINSTSAQQIIYLGGIVNEEQLSKHLSSRKAVEDKLRESKAPVTALRAGIIVGSGSASFEIIRDLVEKLPAMIAPRWIETKCQPIAIRNVIQLLFGVLGKKYTYNQHYDIYGPDTLTYKQMMLQFAGVRKLKRRIWTVPVIIILVILYDINLIPAGQKPGRQYES
jgi:uncharacterized protein YbjT (DUF2867 family)